MTGRLPPHVVLAEERLPQGPISLVAWRDDDGTLWIGIQGPDPFVGAIGCHTGSRDEPVGGTMVGGRERAVLWGYVAPAVERCEIRTREGLVRPARTVTLPRELSTDDRAVWGLVEGRTRWATIVGYDATGRVVGPSTYPTGAAETIGRGDHPDLGPWSVSVVPRNHGLTLEFELERRGGGGSSLDPLEGRDLDGLQYGHHRTYADVAGTVSPRVARVEVALDDGRRIPADLFDIPERYVGPARAFAALFAGGHRLAGSVIAYGTDGGELARHEFGREGPPPDGEHSARSDTVRF